MTLRELREWHWNKVLSFRTRAEDFERRNPTGKNRYSANQARAAHGRANWHLGAVQALNDCFPIGDTAGQKRSNT
jgi:hypothetical protein